MLVFVKTMLLGLAAFLWVIGGFAQSIPSSAHDQNRRLGRGVNILGYDPVWRSPDQARFQTKHFEKLREAGFQSVRVNLHAFRHMDPARHWELKPAWWNTLDWAVTNATSRGLQVILDLHEFNAMGQNAVGENHDKFLAFWKQVSDRFRDAPSSVVFEILNEPNKALGPELWNAYLREALAIIRASNPTRNVVVGPAFWNSVDRLRELDLPADDRHLIVTVHYYKPMKFTHQGASWTPENTQLGIAWGTDAERQAVRADFDRVQAWAKEHDRPIHLGEFGAYDKAPMESRIRYTDAVARAAEALGWSWSYWQFDSDFLLWDIRSDDWVHPILQALAPPRP